MFKSFFAKNPYLQGRELPVSLALYMVGMVAIGMGAVLTINSHAGAGGYDALTFVLSDICNIRISYVIYLIATIALIIAALIRRTFPRLTSFITAFLLGLIVDAWKSALVNIQATSFLSSILFLFGGMLLVAFGVGAYLLSKLPANPIDDLVLALTERSLSLQMAKLCFDIPCFVLAFFLGGQLGWGTVVITLGLGPLIQVWYNILRFCLARLDLARN